MIDAAAALDWYQGIAPLYDVLDYPFNQRRYRSRRALRPDRNRAASVPASLHRWQGIVAGTQAIAPGHFACARLNKSDLYQRIARGIQSAISGRKINKIRQITWMNMNSNMPL